MSYIETAKAPDAFKILSDPTRYKVLALLFRNPGTCVNDIARKVGISHSAASHQLSKLEAKGIVACSRDGKTMCYQVCQTTLTKKLKQAMKIFN